MTLSDLLTLLGIILAILAFISERNREFIFLKFSIFDKILGLISVLFIHYLISFEWFQQRFPILNIFDVNWLPTPSVWAYIVSVVTIIWAIYKMFYADFPLENLKRILKYYDGLIKRNDMIFLTELIEKYHLKHIKSYLIKKKTITVPSFNESYEEDKYSKAIKKAINKPKLIYANNVFHRIVKNQKFITNVADSYPYLFSDIIIHINKENVKEVDFVNDYLKVLSVNKNRDFFEEIKNNNNYFKNNSYRIERERPILYSLFWDIKVAELNEIWRGIGEQAILELQNEVKEKYSRLRDEEYERDKETINSYLITNAISFFDIMIRRAIYRQSNNHFWLSYYQNFTDLLIDNMYDSKNVNYKTNGKSRNFELIEIIIGNMIDWKDVSIKSKNYNLIPSIYDCIGRCMFSVIATNKLDNESKLSILDLIWTDLIETSVLKEEQFEEVEAKVVDVGINMFLKPSYKFDVKGSNEESVTYKKVITDMYSDRDTAIEVGIVKDRSKRFFEIVLSKFGTWVEVNFKDGTEENL